MYFEALRSTATRKLTGLGAAFLIGTAAIWIVSLRSLGPGWALVRYRQDHGNAFKRHIELFGNDLPRAYECPFQVHVTAEGIYRPVHVRARTGLGRTL